MAPNYKSSKVYKLISNNSLSIYIGSTTQSLSVRKAEHLKHFNQFLDGKREWVCKSGELFFDGDVDIILLEEFECDNKEQLRAKEREYIEKNNCLNKNIPNQTIKEWRDKNKDSLKHKHNEYYKSIKHLRQTEEYKLKTKISRKPYNPDTDKRKTEEGRLKRKESRNKQTKHICDCGSSYNSDTKSRHLKTKKHQEFALTEDE
jgi:hypothetical protein